MSKKLEYKHIDAANLEEFEWKADENGIKRLLVKGYAAVFGNEDSYGDVIEKGAFTETIQGKNGSRIAFCWQHDIRQPIGNVLVLKEDDKGLYFEALVSASESDKATKIEEKIIKEFSIGYWTEQKEYQQNEVDGREIRILKKLGLAEFSAVTRAANDEATVIGTERKEEEFKAMTEDLDKKSDEDLIDVQKKLENSLHEVKNEIEKRVLLSIN